MVMVKVDEAWKDHEGQKSQVVPLGVSYLASDFPHGADGHENSVFLVLL